MGIVLNYYFSYVAQYECVPTQNFTFQIDLERHTKISNMPAFVKCIYIKNQIGKL